MPDNIPAWAADLPENIQKFATDDPAESFIKLAGAYGEASTKIGEQGTQLGELRQQLASAPPPTPGETREFGTLDDIVGTAGLKMDDLVAAHSENGSLTDEQYAALGKLGFQKGAVDAIIQGQVAQGQLKEASEQALVTAAFSAAGGEAEYNVMVEWAKAGLTPQEIAAFNDLISGPKRTETSIKQGVEWLSAKYALANGGAPAGGGPARITAPAGAGATGAFTSRDEAMNAMKDARYWETLPGTTTPNPKYDPQFRKQADARLLATTKAQGVQ